MNSFKKIRADEQTSIMTENKNNQPGYGFGLLVAFGMTFGVVVGAIYGTHSGNIF